MRDEEEGMGEEREGRRRKRGEKGEEMREGEMRGRMVETRQRRGGGMLRDVKFPR